MGRIGAALIVLILVGLVLGNAAALVTWIVGGSLGDTLTNALIVFDVVAVVGVLLAGAAFVAVFIYAMSKDSS